MTRDFSSAAHGLQGRAEAERLHADQLARERPPGWNFPQPIRWAVTTDDGEEASIAYPYEAANVVPIRFLDTGYTKTPGVQALGGDPRHTEAQTVARVAAGQWLPPGLPVPVFEQRSLTANKGVWHILEAPRLYFGKVVGSALTPGGTCQVEIWLPAENAPHAWERTDCTVTAYDAFLAVDEMLPEGTRVAISWQLHCWTIMRWNCEPDPELSEWGDSPACDCCLVRFRLTGSLSTGGNSTAKLLTWTGAAYAEGDTISVYDHYSATAQAPGGARGMWQAISGMEGYARLREVQPEDEEQPRQYDIVWMEQYARLIEFTLTADMSSSSAAATVTASWDQGCPPGSTLTVHDPQNRWRDAIEGCKGTAIRDEYAQTDQPTTPYYRIVSCQRAAKRAKASLSAAMCGSSPSLSSPTWMVYQQGDFVADPGQATIAVNLAGHRGMAGDYVWLERVSNTQPFQWHVVDVEKHPLQLLTCATSLSGDPAELVKCCVTAAVEVCELPPCAEEETSSSAPSSSSGVDVPPNSSVYACCDLPTAPDPAIDVTGSWSTCGGTGSDAGSAIESSVTGGKLVAGAFGAGLYEAWFGEASPYCVTSIKFYCVENGSTFFLRDSSGDELAAGVYAVLRMYCTGAGSGALSGGYYVVPAAVLSCDPIHWTAEFDLSAENLAWIETSGVWGPSFNILENTDAQDCTVDIEVTE